MALFLFAASALHAATVRGNVVENQTGKPLSRVLMKLLPLPGSSAAPLTTWTGTYGVFDFSNVPAGAWLLSASRKDCVTVQYGQKQWTSAGQPIILDDSTAVSLNIRMPRFGAITGRVLDENDVGIPNQQVVAYRNSRPPELIARSTADEQGRFRIYGLVPGPYVVRSAAWQDESISYVPTFSKESGSVEEARTVEVALDQEVDSADIKPMRGTLFQVAGTVFPSLNEEVKLTFATDMGREVTKTAGGFQFGAVPPGIYEIYAEGPGGPRCDVLAAWQEVDLRKPHRIDLTVPCMSPATVGIMGKSGEQPDPAQFQVLARRVDRAGPGEIQEIAAGPSGAMLLPGRWQVMLKTPPGYYAAQLLSSSMAPNQRRADGWNDITITRAGRIVFVVATSPGGVHGQVTGKAHEAVAGAPVYLEPVDATSGARIGDLHTAVTDTRGQYHFYGLAPGQYRILATFEYQSPDEDTMARSAKTISISERTDTDLALDLFVL
ncbi:MAG: carboxypeptidase-like regulatory domain-containing protein [Candidatus Sulfopaludibacter sp.]|nr:carboxypeptidase-like regulatory domain-containing protein [Candidatus Sulfopaludibacter sp.]